jgi:hypothetical protein
MEIDLIYRTGECRKSLRMTNNSGSLPSHALRTAELDETVATKGGYFGLRPETGGLGVLFQSIFSRFDSHITTARARFYTDAARPIQYAIINNLKVNAFAYATGRESPIQFDFVGINLGSILLLFEYFHRILSNPKNLPDIGDPSKEDPSLPTLTHVSPESLFDDMMRHRPKCPVRARLAGEISEIAIDFLFLHELTHIQNGHLEYLRYHRNRNHLSEAFESTETAEDKLILQTLEWDADCGGIDRTLIYTFNAGRRLMPQLDRFTPDLRLMIERAYASPESIARFVQFAIYTSFRLFAVEWTWEKQPYLTHPLHAYRMASLLVALDAILQKRGEALNYSAAEFADASIKTIEQAEVAFSTLTGDPPDLDPLMSVFGNTRHVEYVAELERTWKEMRPTLDRYKRGGTLAP